MTLDFNPGDDLADVMDGLTSVTLLRPGSSNTIDVAHALCRTVRTREIRKSEGRYTAGDVAWHLPDGELSWPPRVGDVIVDADDRRWTVLDVQATTLEGRWRCVCRNLAVEQGLDQYVDVEKATYQKGDSGADQPTWQAWKTGLRARIQPVETRMTHEHERRTSQTAFRIFLLEDVLLDHTHRVRGPDGTVYRVVGCRKSERIDALMEIDVRRVS